jgi:hypothetical protein
MKRWLIDNIPEFVRKRLLYWKYKSYNVRVHRSNIEQKRIVRVVCRNEEKYAYLKELLRSVFGGYVRIDGERFHFHPVAIIENPGDTASYRKMIGPKSRNMLKKAHKSGVVCRPFEWNERLDEIFDIHRSATIRQGKRMSDAYLRYPQKVCTRPQEDFRIVHLGAFAEDRLVGYVELYIYGNFAMVNRILGHKAYLKYAIMNALIEQCVSFMIETDIAYLNYLTMQNRQNNTLSAFKYRVGFREYSLVAL